MRSSRSSARTSGARAGGREVRRLVLVMGDQLDPDSAAFDGFDPGRDAVLMVEARREATYVPQHKHRLVLFFAAMRHFRDALRERGRDVRYVELDDPENRGSFGEEVPRWLRATRAERLVVLQPGDHRVDAELREALAGEEAALEVREDRHFLCGRGEFEAFADGRRTLVMETFYRRMRRTHGVLLEPDGGPAGGRWNFDRENRASFGRDGPPEVPPSPSFAPDELTARVARLVDEAFPDGPGSTSTFDHAVTAAQAREALEDFVAHRLAGFGRFQDAMASGHPFLWHSRLSSSLNLHLVDPRRAIELAVAAYEDGAAPLSSVEGFVRQVLGWREYVRAVYWREMPEYAERNALGAELPVPAFLWTGETDMRCVRECVGELVEHAWTHHIQRLMVLGLFCLLLGCDPREVNRWHHSMYVDAVDQVSLPNVQGMSQYADGGLLATKPYCASGAYLQRMSDYCRGCRFDPRRSSGEEACPFTTLYWDFLSRNRARLRGNHRMGFQLKNLDRKPRSERRAVRERAAALKEACTARTWL